MIVSGISYIVFFLTLLVCDMEYGRERLLLRMLLSPVTYSNYYIIAIL